MIKKDNWWDMWYGMNALFKGFSEINLLRINDISKVRFVVALFKYQMLFLCCRVGGRRKALPCFRFALQTDITAGGGYGGGYDLCKIKNPNFTKTLFSLYHSKV